MHICITSNLMKSDIMVWYLMLKSYIILKWRLISAEVYHRLGRKSQPSSPRQRATNTNTEKTSNGHRHLHLQRHRLHFFIFSTSNPPISPFMRLDRALSSVVSTWQLCIPQFLRSAGYTVISLDYCTNTALRDVTPAVSISWDKFQITDMLWDTICV